MKEFTLMLTNEEGSYLIATSKDIITIKDIKHDNANLEEVRKEINNTFGKVWQVDAVEIINGTATKDLVEDETYYIIEKESVGKTISKICAPVRKVKNMELLKPVTT